MGFYNTTHCLYDYLVRPEPKFGELAGRVGPLKVNHHSDDGFEIQMLRAPSLEFKLLQSYYTTGCQCTRASGLPGPIDVVLLLVWQQ
jgi:hypothetical protein